jgi:hypothetical protein
MNQKAQMKEGRIILTTKWLKGKLTWKNFLTLLVALIIGATLFFRNYNFKSKIFSCSSEPSIKKINTGQ